MLTISSVIIFSILSPVCSMYCISDTYSPSPSLTFVSVGMPWAGRQDSRSRPNTSTFADGVREQIRLQQEAAAAAAAAPPPFPGVQGLRITLTGVRVTSYSQTEPESQTRKGCSSNALRKLDSHILSFSPPPPPLSLSPSLTHSLHSLLRRFPSSISHIVFSATTALLLLPGSCGRNRTDGRNYAPSHRPTVRLYAPSPARARLIRSHFHRDSHLTLFLCQNNLVSQLRSPLNRLQPTVLKCAAQFFRQRKV